MEKTYLVLKNGRVFPGEGFGARPGSGARSGELVFTTGMGGCLETLTDPAHCGQIVVGTFPMAGNYGVIPADFESEKCFAAGYVVNTLCGAPSNFRSEGSLDDFLRGQGVPGISGLDTRELTGIIRRAGTVEACITDDPAAAAFGGTDGGAPSPVSVVSVKKPVVLPAVGERKYKIALLDLGARVSMQKSLCARGAEVTRLPYDTCAAEIKKGGYDGLALSGGPGDPAENPGCIREISALLGELPIFGVCLGHLLLGLVAGGKTGRLAPGHRGQNRPVRDLKTGRVYVTSQNHGHALLAESLENTPGEISHAGANDGSVEGVEYPGLFAFSVQFHPEDSGPVQGSPSFYDRFFEMIDGYRAKEGGRPCL